ncbi:DNA-binding domain-containing protein [Thalassolituus sp. LLYu03]|uniref:HvfC family RiPP maturation protein n=1 Tax=Thalassolituus sp. LLYu03 TaxID=3421656 RepID=UPI003D26E413
MSDLQHALAGDIRHNTNLTGIAPDRLGVYQEVFFNNIKGFADSAFPVLRALIGDDAWTTLVRQWFEHEKLTTPYFLRIAAEFLDWFQRTDLALNSPALAELAHYEWLELAVDTSDDKRASEGDILAGVPVLASGAQGAFYQYPVHTLSTEHPVAEAAPTALIVFRDQTDKVRFLHTSPATLSLLLTLQAEALSGRDAIQQLLGQMNLSHSQAAQTGAEATLQQWYRDGLILGVKP